MDPEKRLIINLSVIVYPFRNPLTLSTETGKFEDRLLIFCRNLLLLKVLWFTAFILILASRNVKFKILRIGIKSLWKMLNIEIIIYYNFCYNIWITRPFSIWKFNYNKSEIWMIIIWNAISSELSPIEISHYCFYCFKGYRIHANCYQYYKIDGSQPNLNRIQWVHKTMCQ